MRKLSLVALTVSMMLMANVSLAEESAISFEVTNDFYSKYIWRGQNVVDDWVYQPGVSMSVDNLTLGIWGNLDMTDENGESGEFTEIDYYVDYTTTLAEGVDFSVGAIAYYFPGANNTTELYWGFAFDLPFSPYVTVYHDVDEVSGTYVAVGGGYSVESLFELSPEMPVGMELGVNLGWGNSGYNNGYFSVNDSGLNDLTISLAFPVAMGDWTLSPSVNYATLMDSDIEDAVSYDSDNLFFGVGLSTSF